MVVVDSDKSVDLDEETEKETSEAKISDEANIEKETDLQPTEFERFKAFTQKVAQCAARSFCETYVRPLVIKNPNLLPSESETVTQSEVQSATLFNPAEDVIDDAVIIVNPKEDEEEEQFSSIQNQRREMEKENDRGTAVVNPNNKDHTIASTIILLQEKDMITVDKAKPSLSLDIAKLLSYLPCQSLIACGQKDENNGDPVSLELKPIESVDYDINSSSSQPRDSQDRQKEDD